MQRYVDLHTHSTASDGTCTPAEVVRLATEARLKAFALTDHDTTRGIKEAAAELKKLKESDKTVDTEFVPGIEISAEYKNRDIHILGLFIDPENEELQATLDETVFKREERNLKMLSKFDELGIHMTIEELQEGNPDTVITRAHFARVLTEKGYVKDKNEAFKRYLDRSAVCYVPRAYLTPERTVKTILKAGGVPILAHPMLYDLSLDEINVLLKDILVPAGLKGIEVLHSTNKEGDKDTLLGFAKIYSLATSGGSDFHGENKPDIKIGIGRGNLKVPESYLESVRKCIG